MKRNESNSLAASSRYPNSRYPAKKVLDQDPEPEVDYFQELQLEPSIRKTKKVC